MARSLAEKNGYEMPNTEAGNVVKNICDRCTLMQCQGNWFYLSKMARRGWEGLDAA
jgi:hypothetical protein